MAVAEHKMVREVTKIQHDIGAKSTVFMNKVPRKRFGRQLSHSQIGMGGASPSYPMIRTPSLTREKMGRKTLQEAVRNKDVPTLWRYYMNLEDECKGLSNRDLSEAGRTLSSILVKRLEGALKSDDDEQLKEAVGMADGKLQILSLGRGNKILKRAKERLGMDPDELPEVRAIVLSPPVTPRARSASPRVKRFFSPAKSAPREASQRSATGGIAGSKTKTGSIRSITSDIKSELWADGIGNRSTVRSIASKTKTSGSIAGSIAGRSATGGSIAGRTATGGSIAGRSATGGSIAGRTATGGSIAGRTASVGSVAGRTATVGSVAGRTASVGSVAGRTASVGSVSGSVAGSIAGSIASKTRTKTKTDGSINPFAEDAVSPNHTDMTTPSMVDPSSEESDLSEPEPGDDEPLNQELLSIADDPSDDGASEGPALDLEPELDEEPDMEELASDTRLEEEPNEEESNQEEQPQAGNDDCIFDDEDEAW